MRDIISRLSDIDNTPDRPSKASKAKKKLLKEEKTPRPIEVTKSSTFKDVFENMSALKPLPVVGQAGSNNQQQGAGFIDIDDNSPSAKAIQGALSDLVTQNKAQIVMPTNPADAPNNMGAQGMQAVQQNQQAMNNQTNQQGQVPLREVEAGDTITVSLPNTDEEYDVEYQFDDNGDVEILSVYSLIGGEVGEDMTDYITDYDMREIKSQVESHLQNNKDDRGDYEYEQSQDRQLDELSPDTLQSYAHKAAGDETKIAATGDMSKNNMRKLGNRVNGRSLAYSKMAKKDSVDETQLDELSPATLGSYAKKASTDLVGRTTDHDYMTGTGHNLHDKAIARNQRKGLNRHQGISKAVDKMTGSARVPANEEKLDELSPKTLTNYRAITKGQLRDIASLEPSFGKNQDQSKDRETRKAKRLKGLNLAGKKLQDTLEEAKPDFLDLDKDGNKKEPMKKAAADKKKQKVKESAMRSNPKISAAKHEGKTHGLRGHAYHGKTYDDLEEQRAYHEGYKEGLDEGYMSEDMTVPSSIPTMEAGYGSNEAAELEAIGEQIINLAEEAMQLVRGTSQEAAARSYWYPHILGAVSKENAYGGGSMITLMDTAQALDADGEEDEDFLGEYEDDFGEGNSFTGNLAKARATGADEFDLDGDGDMEPVLEFDDVFESWTRQLNELISEGTSNSKKSLTEGMTLSINKGNGMGSDSVSVTATDQDADELLGLIRNAGLGLFGDEQVSEPSSAMSIQPPADSPEAEIEVVDGADSMLGLMQKLSGIEGTPATGGDYEPEDSGEEVEVAVDGEEAMIGADWGFGSSNYSTVEVSDEESDGEEVEDSEEYGYEESDEDDADSEESDSEDTETEEEDEEEKVDEGEQSCMECGGMMEAGHSCGSKEMVEESRFLGLIKKLSKLNEGDEFDSEGHLASPETMEGFTEKVINSDDPFELVNDGLKGVYGDEVLEQLQQCQDEVVQDSEGSLHPDDDYEEIVDRIIEKLNEPEEDDEMGDMDFETDEQLNELSTDTLKSYKKKATSEYDRITDADEDEVHPDEYHTMDKRAKGINMADKKLSEWANQAGKGEGKGTKAQFTLDTEFMTQTIAGGANKPKSTGQTTVPVVASQTDRQHDRINESTEDWMRLAGIKKS